MVLEGSWIIIEEVKSYSINSLVASDCSDLMFLMFHLRAEIISTEAEAEAASSWRIRGGSSLANTPPWRVHRQVRIHLKA